MHIPDNFLSTPVWAALDTVAIPAVAFVSRQAQKATESNRLPLLGVMGAFVFAAQMINFPVGIGTSGHLVGATLLACLLGPWAASLVVTSILLVQALIFQDGGVLALGANVFNMALVGVFAGYLPARILNNTRWRFPGVFLGGTLSVLICGLLALTELRLSGIRMSAGLFQISVGLFTVNALIEGAITVSVLRAIERLHPSVSNATIAPSRPSPQPAASWKKAIAYISVAAITLGSVGVLLASRLPDSLEHLAAKLGLPFGEPMFFRTPLTAYQVQVLGSGWLSRATAGLVGLVVVYLVCALGGHLLGRVRRSYS
jgi:cobalt/nickel transport system permease protein